MLEKIRNQVKGTFGKVLLFIFCAPFVLFGVDSVFTSGSASDVAEVNGEAITAQELDQQIYLKKRELTARMGENYNPALVEDSVLRGPALQSLIQERIFDQTAESYGISIGKSQLDNIIIGQQEFQLDGKFSGEMYENRLQSAGLSPRIYKNMLREQILQGQLISGFYAGAFVTGTELRLAASVFAQQRNIDYFLVSLAKYGEGIEATEEEILQYYTDNASRYLTEEQLTVNFVELQLSDFYEPVSEEDVRAEYESEVAKFTAQHQRQIAHILLEVTDSRDEQSAIDALNSIKQRIATGEDFAAIAAEISEDPGSAGQGGDLGLTDGTVFPENFEAAAAELTVGEISDPVVTDAGVHLIKVITIQDDQPPTFEQMRPQITEHIQRSIAEPLFVEEMEGLADISYGADSLSDPAEKLGLELQVSEPFGRNGTVEGIFANPSVLQAAFSEAVLNGASNSDVIELNENHVVVIRLKEHKLPAPIPLENVVAQIREDLIRDKSAQQVEQAVASALTALAEGKTLNELALEFGEQVKSYPKVSRRESGSIDPAIMDAAFSASYTAGENSYLTHTMPDGSVAVIAVSELVNGELSALSTVEQQTLHRLLLRNRATAITLAYEEALKQRSEISVVQVVQAESETN